MKKNTGIIEAMQMLRKEKDGIAAFTAYLIALKKGKEYEHGWQYIVLLGDKFKETEKDKRKLFKVAFGTKAKFSMRKVNALLRQLVAWIDEFLMRSQLVENGAEATAMANVQRSRGDHKAAVKITEAALGDAASKDEMSKHSISATLLFDQYNYGKEEKKEKHAILLKAEVEFDNFILIRKLRTIADRLYFCRLGGSEIDEKLSKDIKIYFQLIPENPQPLIALLVLVIRSYFYRSMEDYQALKRAFFDKENQLYSQQKYLLTALVNAISFMIPPMPCGRQEYFTLFKFGFDNDIFIRDGELESMPFSNFVFVLKSLGEFGLLRQFIDSHQQLIKDKKERDNDVKMAECYLLMGEGNYYTAFLDLAFVEPTHPIYAVRKYIAQFICLYEYEPIVYDAHIKTNAMEDRFRRLLYKYRKHKKINEENFQANLNFLKFILVLTNTMEYDNTVESLTSLLEEFNELIVEKSWILEKIAEHN